MSALADALRALMVGLVPVSEAQMTPTERAAHAVLRERSPCEFCSGRGDVCTRGGGCFPCLARRWPCGECSGAGWTPASVEAAIAREEERERLDAALLSAACRWCEAEGGSVTEDDAHIALIEAYGERQDVKAST